MKHRETVLSTVLAVVCLATPALGQPASAGRAPDGSPAPRTSWGTPDLTGVWDHGTATPLERPERYEGREFLTAEEIAEANVNATTFATSERRGELSAERDVGLAYNQFWWDRGLSDGRTALINAGWRGDPDIAETLLEVRAAPDIVDHDSKSALIWAASNGNLSVTALLVDAGADLDIQDKQGLSALMRAAWNGHTRVVETLLKGGAGGRLKDNSGQTALDHAMREEYDDIIALLKSSAN